MCWHETVCTGKMSSYILSGAEADGTSILGVRQRSSTATTARGRGSLFFLFFSVSKTLIDLLSVTAPLGESGPSSRGLAEHDVAATAEHDRLGVAEDGRDLEAAGALDVHEEAIRALDEALELVGSGL